LNWISRNYVAQSAMTLRRELDDQWGNESFVQLLRELIARPGVISRRRFRATWDSAHWSRDEIDRDFDRWPYVKVTADPADDHIDPLRVREDVAKLSAETQFIKDHIERTIAHKGPVNAKAKVPTFREFHASAQTVRVLFAQYYSLLTHRSIGEFEPAPQYNEYEAFRFSWIGDDFDYSKAE
jgi:hypothetical protein